MSRSTIGNFLVFLVLAVGLGTTWWYVDKEFFPKPPPRKPAEPEPKPLSTRERMQVVAGSAAAVDGTVKPPVVPPKVEPPKIEPPKESEPHQLVALGGEGFFKRVLLTSRGAAVQQVILPSFDESTREGKDARDAAGKSRPLHLLPGTVRLREKSIHKNWDYQDLTPGTNFVPGALEEPSYLLYHYPAVGDPDRVPDAEGVKPDNFPSDLLVKRNWKLVKNEPSVEGSESRVVFETELLAPYFIRITKTYTLAPKDYHIGLKLEFSALPGRPATNEKDRAKLRYQIAGARGMPIEGEWYTTSYRNALVGWITPSGVAKRTIEDAASIHTGSGGTQVLPTDGAFTYAGICNQYFASVLAVDDTQPDDVKKNLWAYVRPTRELWSGTRSAKPENPRDSADKPFLGDQLDKPFLGDITVRAVSTPIDPQPNQTITHQYLIYNGPLKVRLLKQLRTDRAVSDELEDRYLNKLTLKTLADYHSPHFFGRVANSIWWADLVIWFTNVMHSVLGGLHRIVPVWGVDILLLTVLVRLLLLVPSRRQQIVMARMQEKMAALKPEIEKIAEKYKGDPHRINQEKTKLMLQNGVNPLSSMSGCLLMFAQMPVFLGLYFCLQESIFFRLESFLWFPNLAAPDMLINWTEHIPFISDPESLGGMLYLGPYFNILPVIAVGLMFIHQKLSMPPPTDEQQEMQQRMMKIMMIVMGVFFFKMAAGLCIYFIASTSWGLIEKKLIPKSEIKPNGTGPDGGGSTPSGGGDSTPQFIPAKSAAAPSGPAPAPTGFLGRLKAKVEEMQRQADEQAKRQIRNEPRDGDGKRDKKKKRK